MRPNRLLARYALCLTLFMTAFLTAFAVVPAHAIDAVSVRGDAPAIDLTGILDHQRSDSDRIQVSTAPGTDGIVGTADDGAVEAVRKPGPDGILGNTDDEIVTLTNFSREVILTPLNFPNTANVNPSLRQVTVNIRYLVENTWQTYTLTTYVSSFS